MKIISCLLLSAFVFADVGIQGVQSNGVNRVEYKKASKACWVYNEKALKSLLEAEKSDSFIGIDAYSNLSRAHLERYRQCIQDTILLKGE